MGIANNANTLSMFTADDSFQTSWTAIDSDHGLGFEAALPYLLDHAPATFAEPAPAVVSTTRHHAA